VATDKIVAEYTVKVDQALKQLDALAGKVNKLDQETKKTEQGFKDMSSSMVSNLSKVGAAIGVAFGAREIVAFGAETVKLAAQAEGVERAFKRIGGGQYLQGLRDATRGTVTDLVLMQNAVKASNFKIPLENLASLFKFAQARARETGESVDYLVDSIILGIGRKSPLILDNLGISAIALRDKLKGVGTETASVGDIAKAVGDIATEEMAKMGDQADTTADKIAQLEAAWANLQSQIGKTLIDLSKQLGLISDARPYETQIRGTMDYQTAVNDASKAILDAYEREKRVIDELGESAEQRAKAEAFAAKEKELRITSLADKEAELAKLTTEETRKSEALKINFAQKRIDAAVGFNIVDRSAAKEALANVYADIKARITRQGVLQDQIDTLKTILGIQKELTSEISTDNEVRSIELLNAQLAELRKQFESAEIGGVDFYRIADLIEAKIKEIDKAMRLLVERKYKNLPTDEIASINITEIDAQKATTDAILDDYAYRNGEILKGIKARDEALRVQAEKDAIRQKEIALDMTTEMLNTISSVAGSIATIVQNQVTSDLQQLERQYEAGEITREEFEQKQKQLQTRSAQSAKDAALFQAIVGTAQAVINALATPGVPFPVAAGFAALAGAIGAVQIAAIATQPLPQFAEGGWVDSKGQIHGRSHKQGGVKIEAEGNEFITKGKYAKPNADILEAINTGNWEKYKFDNIIAPAIDKVLDGGLEGMGASYMLQNQFNDRNLLKAIDRHRTSDKDGFVYLANEISKNMKRQSRWS
jgi:hypothetical protein